MQCIHTKNMPVGSIMVIDIESTIFFTLKDYIWLTIIIYDLLIRKKIPKWSMKEKDGRFFAKIEMFLADYLKIKNL